MSLEDDEDCKGAVGGANIPAPLELLETALGFTFQTVVPDKINTSKDITTTLLLNGSA